MLKSSVIEKITKVAKDQLMKNYEAQFFMINGCSHYMVWLNDKDLAFGSGKIEEVLNKEMGYEEIKAAFTRYFKNYDNNIDYNHCRHIKTMEELMTEAPWFNMWLPKIKSATAIYTGGGIYIYYGELDNGTYLSPDMKETVEKATYFRTSDTDECIEICDTDTSVDEADYIEFYEEHRVRTVIDNQYTFFFNKMLAWFIANKPEGNYSVEELNNRIIITKRGEGNG